MSETHVLLVEDDPDISEPLSDFLSAKGYRVIVAASAEVAGRRLKEAKFDLVLLDVMLPGEDGFALCRRIRASDKLPIIMLTALSEATDKVIGLELGADDYVSKPFDLRELLARMRALLRRSPGHEGPAMFFDKEQSLRFLGFTFFPQRRYLRSPSGLRIPLTGAETDLLLVFCQNRQKVLSRDELITLTRGEGYAISARSVDLLVSRLRRKFVAEDPLLDPLRTIRTDGYAFYPDISVD